MYAFIQSSLDSAFLKGKGYAGTPLIVYPSMKPLPEHGTDQSINKKFIIFSGNFMQECFYFYEDKPVNA